MHLFMEIPFLIKSCAIYEKHDKKQNFQGIYNCSFSMQKAQLKKFGLFR